MARDPHRSRRAATSNCACRATLVSKGNAKYREDHRDGKKLENCRANGVCFLTDATRLLVTNDAVRSCGSDACQLGLTRLEFRTAVDCAHAASDAAPRTTTSNCAMLRARAPETEQHAPIATYERSEHSMEDMLHPPISLSPATDWLAPSADSGCAAAATLAVKEQRGTETPRQFGLL
jgi:hypothetical protein